MTKRERASIGRASLLLLGTALSSGLAAPAIAQSTSTLPTIRSVLDKNGIDLSTGTMVLSKADVSIGPKNSGLVHSRTVWGVGWRDSYVITLNATSTSATVSFAGSSVTFSRSGNNFLTEQDDGSTLTFDGSQTYTYTDKTGVKYVFAAYYSPTSTSSQCFANVNCAVPTALVSKIVRPDGEITTVNYEDITLSYVLPNYTGYTAYFRRIGSVSNNLGYRLIYHYASNATGQYDIGSWGTLASVTAVNNAVESCTTSTCTLSQTWPTASYGAISGGYTTADAQGLVTIYDWNTSGNGYGLLHKITLPGNTSGTPDITLNYDSSSLVSSVTNAGVTTSYSFTPNSSTGVMNATVTRPDGKTDITTADMNQHVLLADTNALGQTTRYLYNTGGQLTEFVPPDATSGSGGTSTGGYIYFIHGVRGNLTAAFQYPKSGTSSYFETIFVYPSSCTNAAVCNKPTSVTDANGNETDYTYNATTGQVVSVTRPAPSGTSRPETVYSYSSLDAYYKDASGNIVSSGQPISVLSQVSTCQTQGVTSPGAALPCTNSSDEVRTTIGYGPQTAGTANNLLPVSVTKGSGDGSLSATTTSSYDAVGNLATVDGPLAGSADTVAYHYDNDRRLIGVVAPDPDGSGSLLPMAKRYNYDPSTGLLTTAQIGTVASQSDSPWDSNFVLGHHDFYHYNANRRVDRHNVWSNSSGSNVDYSVTDFVYDTDGRPSCSVEYMNPSNWGPQASSCQPLQTTGPNGPDRVREIGYDAVGRVLTVTQGVGTSAAAVVQTNVYTTGGQLASVKDGEGNLTSYSYDGYDRLAQINYPNIAQGNGSSNSSDYEQLSYDANGNVLTHRLRDGNTTSYSYDHLNRVTNIAPPGESAVSYSYDLLGHPLRLQKGTVILNYTWDALGRMLSAVQPFGWVSYAYDLAGQRTQLTWNDGFHVNYSVTAVYCPHCRRCADRRVWVLSRCGSLEPCRCHVMMLVRGQFDGWRFSPAQGDGGSGKMTSRRRLSRRAIRVTRRCARSRGVMG